MTDWRKLLLVSQSYRKNAVEGGKREVGVWADRRLKRLPNLGWENQEGQEEDGPSMDFSTHNPDPHLCRHCHTIQAKAKAKVKLKDSRQRQRSYHPMNHRSNLSCPPLNSKRSNRKIQPYLKIWNPPFHPSYPLRNRYSKYRPYRRN